MRQYWLGQPVKLAGVASVKVAPEHRGRGIGRTLMTELLDVIAERGYPLSALYPATTPIYRSLGWELAGAKHKFCGPRPLAARPRRTGQGGAGRGSGPPGRPRPPGRPGRRRDGHRRHRRKATAPPATLAR